MTLNEYLNQDPDNPVEKPTVFVEPTEYNVVNTYPSGSKTSGAIVNWYVVTIPELDKKYPDLMPRYMVEENTTQLWTIDDDGNPKSRSVFFINKW